MKLQSAFGAEDLFAILGIACIVLGVALWSVPAALIVLGLVAIGVASLIATTKAKAGKA